MVREDLIEKVALDESPKGGTITDYEEIYRENVQRCRNSKETRATEVDRVMGE